jgi:hypothetical protein
VNGVCVIARQSDQYRKQRSEPISFVAAEIHLGLGPAGISGGWLEIPYSSCVPTQHSLENFEKSICCGFCIASNEQ